MKLDMNKLNANLKAGRFSRYYLLYGEERYLVRQYAKRICEAVCMVLTLCPAVRADGDPGYVDGAPRNFVRIHWSGGEWIYEKGYGSSGALPSGVSFNAASGTLTLRNADLGPVDIYAWGANKVTIVAEGVNTLSSLSISACHNVEIRGSGTINAGPDAPAEDGGYYTALSFYDVYVPEERDGERPRRGSAPCGKSGSMRTLRRSRRSAA